MGRALPSLELEGFERPQPDSVPHPHHGRRRAGQRLARRDRHAGRRPAGDSRPRRRRTGRACALDQDRDLGRAHHHGGSVDRWGRPLRHHRAPPDRDRTPRRRLPSSRVAMWWSEARVVGSGLGSFAVAFPRFRTLRAPAVMSHAESDWLGLLVETGAIGFLLAAATAVSLAVMLLRRRRRSRTYSARVQALAGLVALIGAAVQSLPNYNLPVMSNLIYLSLALVIY